MGLKVKVGGVWKDVTTSVAYRVGSSGGYVESKRFLFNTGSGWKDGFTFNTAPPAPTGASFSFTGTTGSSSYDADVSWTNPDDEQDNADTVEIAREDDSVIRDTETVAFGTEGASQSQTVDVTGNNDGSLTYGDSLIRYRLEVTDSEGEASPYAFTAQKTYPPSLPTPSITSVAEVSGVPVPSISWTNGAGFSSHQELTIGRPSASDAVVEVAANSSPYQPSANTGYAGGGTVTLQMRSKSNQNSETTYSPASTSQISYVLPPATPAAPTLTSVSHNSIRFDWSAPSGTYDGYKLVVRRYTSSSSSSAVDETPLYFGTGTTHHSYDVPNGTYKVQFRLQSRNLASAIDYSLNTAASAIVNIPPPSATSLDMTCTNGTWTATWSYGSTTNLTSQQVYYRRRSSNGYSLATGVNVNTRSFQFTGVSGENAQFYVRSFSSSGESNTVISSEFQLPLTPVFGSFVGFVGGTLDVSWNTSSANTGIDLFLFEGTTAKQTKTDQTDDGNYLWSGYAFTDNVEYQVQLQGRNANGTGIKSSLSGLKRKIANPYIVFPSASATFRTGFSTPTARWETSSMRQGVLDASLVTTSSDQELVGFYFYGTQFEALKPSEIGYSLSTIATDSTLHLKRQSTGGGSVEYPYIIGHNYTSLNNSLTSVTTVDEDGNTATAGTQTTGNDGGGYSLSEERSAIIPTAYVQGLLDGNFKGFALRTGETTAPSGSVSANYARFEEYNDPGTIYGLGTGWVYIYHSG